jgi:hypothetical protein
VITACANRPSRRGDSSRWARARAIGICVGLLSVAVAAGGCRSVASSSDGGASRHEAAAPGRTAARVALDAATEEGILALAPDRISDREVKDVLSRGPAPRIINLHGSPPVVTMKPFAEFLVAMGYPEERVRNPRDGAYSYSSYTDSRELAGSLAWYYEREGMMPILIGHSRGGMLVIKVLHELAGEFGETIPVWNPVADEVESRSTIVDPLSGAERPVVGLKVGYATAIATGKLPRVLSGQWTMLPLLRRIPDSVEEFTGFLIEWDLIAGTLPGAEPYRSSGSAAVRTVTLPGAYTHIGIPVTIHLATNKATRAWINQYTPQPELPALPDGADVDTTNIVHAAEIWYSVKKHWCLEAQRLIRAKRGRVAAQG